MAYEDSELEEGRVRDYARKVAKQTRTPATPIRETTYEKYEERSLFGLRRETKQRAVTREVGGFWELGDLYEHVERARDGKTYKLAYEYVDRQTLVLKTDGQLMVRYQEHSGPISYRLATADDLLALDRRESRRQNTTRSGNMQDSWEETTRGGTVSVHAKGVGVSLALKRLLE